MCGIAGYIDFKSGRPHAPILSAMARALHRRGPDAQDTLADGPCGLAHTRLSIIDIEGCPQPMRLPDLPFDLVFNGEIYNYQQLRSELAAQGSPFIYRGDTEVLLRLVARDWQNALPKLDGMFAFAAWNRLTQTLLLARDPIGEKPLFYSTPSPRLLIFGSEIKSLLTHPEVDRAIDEDALRQVLRFRAVYGERSLHKGIRQLMPGCFLEFSATGLRSGRFWDLAEEVDKARETQRGKSQHILQQDGQALFMDSVQERLIADVPVGAFLSGGLDSSLIVAAAQKLRGPGNPIRTFSVGFRNDAFSELSYAKMVADAIGSNHTEVHVTEADYLARLVELTACRDAPISEPADVAIAEMSRVARQSVKVVLSGEGADEVFAGYPKYAFANAPSALRAAIRLLTPDRTASIAGALGLDKRRALVAARALGGASELDRIIQWFSYLDRNALQTLLPGLGWSQEDWARSAAPQADAIARLEGKSPLDKMQGIDCLTWLPGNMLERGDRMTMAEGLEARPPFLDKALIAYGLALPPTMRIRGRVGKWIVRQWSKDLLPTQIAARKKWGFRVPLAQWFRGPLRNMVYELLSERDGLCSRFGNRGAIRKAIAAHESGQVDVSWALWTLLVTEIWYQERN